MTFFKSSTSSTAEANSEEHHEYVDYDNGYAYPAEYDGNVQPGMDGDDMYYQDPMPSEDIDYDDDLTGIYDTDVEHNLAQDTTTNEIHSFPQPLQVQNTAAAAKKSFFDSSEAQPVNAKSTTSSFFGQRQNVSRALSPPLSYISSDSSCGSNDSLVLSGESAEEPFSSMTSGIALTTQTATEGFNDDIPVRASSPLTASTTEPVQAQRLDKVAKQLFVSPTAVSNTSGAASKKPKPTTGAPPPAKSLTSSSAPAPRTAPSSFFSGTAPKFVASKVSVPNFNTTRSSASITPTFGSGFAIKKTNATATSTPAAGSSKPPLSTSSVPSQQHHQQQSSATIKPKLKSNPKSKNVTFQTGTKTTPPSTTTTATVEEATSITQRNDSIEQMRAPVEALSVDSALSAGPSSPGEHISPTSAGSVMTSFAPVTPASYNSNRSSSSNMMTTGVSDRAALHQVTPDTTNHIHRHYTQDHQQQIDGHSGANGDGSDSGAMTVSPAAGASRTVSADDDEDHCHDSSGSYSAVSYSAPACTSGPTTSTTTLSLDSDTQALSLCAQMDQQAEELQDRLRRARDSVKESRTAMVQQIHSAARVHSQYLMEDSVASAVPKLMELQRKMEQLRVRYKAIETARAQQQQRVPMPMEVA